MYKHLIIYTLDYKLEQTPFILLQVFTEYTVDFHTI